MHTIYPPLAQAYFRVVHARSGPGGAVLTLQPAAAAVAIAVTVLLLFGLPRLSIDPRQAVLWAWCPTVALETGNNAHVDVLAALLVGATLLATAITRPRLRVAVTGILLGLAIAVKLTPVLIGPALVRRRPILLISSAAAVVAGLYLPHILAVGAGVVGYLPGYAQEEGYADGSRFALLTLLLPKVAAVPAAVAVLVVAAVAVARVTDPDQPWRGGDGHDRSRVARHHTDVSVVRPTARGGGGVCRPSRMVGRRGGGICRVTRPGSASVVHRGPTTGLRVGVVGRCGGHDRPTTAEKLPLRRGRRRRRTRRNACTRC